MDAGTCKKQIITVAKELGITLKPAKGARHTLIGTGMKLEHAPVLVDYYTDRYGEVPFVIVQIPTEERWEYEERHDAHSEWRKIVRPYAAKHEIIIESKNNRNAKIVDVPIRDGTFALALTDFSSTPVDVQNKIINRLVGKWWKDLPNSVSSSFPHRYLIGEQLLYSSKTKQLIGWYAGGFSSSHMTSHGSLFDATGELHHLRGYLLQPHEVKATEENKIEPPELDWLIEEIKQLELSEPSNVYLYQTAKMVLGVCACPANRTVDLPVNSITCLVTAESHNRGRYESSLHAYGDPRPRRAKTIATDLLHELKVKTYYKHAQGGGAEEKHRRRQLGTIAYWIKQEKDRMYNREDSATCYLCIVKEQSSYCALSYDREWYAMMDFGQRRYGNQGHNWTTETPAGVKYDEFGWVQGDITPKTNCKKLAEELLNEALLTWREENDAK